MKKYFIIIFIILLLCGCTAPQKQENGDDSVVEPTRSTEISDAIPPFSTEQRVILPLPEQGQLTNDPLVFVDTLIDNYEVNHFEKFNDFFTLENIAVEEKMDGINLVGLPSDIFDKGSADFSKPLEEYFETPENNYAVLIRFKTDEIDRLNFSIKSQFGFLTLGFDEGKYPTIDVYGDPYGDPMLYDNWNNYIYQSGEWAYAFFTITNTGQKICYFWPEVDPGNFNYHVSFGDENDSNPLSFRIQVSVKNEVVTISDIWLFSFERVKI